MQIIKNTAIFLGIILFTTILINVFFRAIQFLFNGTFIINADTTAISLVVGVVGGIFTAIYHFIED